MSPIRGTEKVEQILLRVKLPKPLVERITRFQRFIEGLDRAITLDEFLVQAMRDALNGDREFAAWEREHGHDPRPKTAEAREPTAVR